MPGKYPKTEQAARLLMETPPEQLSSEWSRVREAYDEQPDSFVELARLHPAPFCEYVIRNTDSYSPRFGKPILLAPMHVEAIQTIVGNEWTWWMKPRGHGGSTIVAGLVIWYVGQNPDTRVKCVAGDSKIAKKKLSQVDRYFNPGRPEAKLLAEVFPDLKQDPDYEWSAVAKYLLRDGGGADPTFEAAGVLSNATAGRTDILWMDDVTTKKNAITEPALKRKVIESIEDDWLQLLGTSGKAIALSNYWASDDAAQVVRLKAERGAAEGAAKRWVFLRHAIDEHCTPIFNEVWPKKRLLATRAAESARTWARGYACREPTREEMDFRPEWFRYIRYKSREGFEQLVQRVDTATAKTDAAAWNAQAIVGVRHVPRSDANPAGIHLHVFAVRRMKGSLVDRGRWVREAYWRYNVDDLGVELASDGEDLADLLEPILGCTIERIKQYEGKRERLARHQPLFRLGLITFDPSLDPDAILEAGDDDAPNPVAEILGSATTHDCADALEMAIRGILETVDVDLSGLDLDGDEDGDGVAALFDPEDDGDGVAVKSDVAQPGAGRYVEGAAPDASAGEWWAQPAGDPRPDPPPSPARETVAQRTTRRGGFARMAR